VASAGRGKCTKRFALNARKNAKSLLNREKTVRSIARIVFQSVRTKAVKTGFKNHESDHKKPCGYNSGAFLP
jgi:hypothetical protein